MSRLLLAVALVALIAPSAVRAVSLEDFDQGKAYHEVFRRDDGTPIDWAYESSDDGHLVGPDKWYELPGSVCGTGQPSERQTPIDVQGATYDANLTPLRLTIDPEASSTATTFTNNGHSFQVDFDVSANARPVATLEGGPLMGVRRLRQIHFHWGRADESFGSEHTVNGKGAPAEVHFVFWNTNYATVNDAAPNSDGLTVIGVLLDIGTEEQSPFSFLESFLEGILSPSGSQVPLPSGVPLRSLLPANFDTKYYTYAGSLTTPPCYESVTWLVAAERLKITSAALEMFRSAADKHGSLMEENNRPIQPRNGRMLRASFDVSPAAQWQEAMAAWQDAFNQWKQDSCGSGMP